MKRREGFTLIELLVGHQSELRRYAHRRRGAGGTVGAVLASGI